MQSEVTFGEGDRTAGPYEGRKRINFENINELARGSVSGTYNGREDKSNTFSSHVNTARTHGTEDLSGPKIVNVLARTWKDSQFHMQWFPGQAMFAIDNNIKAGCQLKDKLRSLSSPSLQVGTPAILVSAPQVTLCLDLERQSYDAGKTTSATLTELKTIVSKTSSGSFGGATTFDGVIESFTSGLASHITTLYEPVQKLSTALVETANKINVPTNYTTVDEFLSAVNNALTGKYKKEVFETLSVTGRQSDVPKQDEPHRVYVLGLVQRFNAEWIQSALNYIKLFGDETKKKFGNENVAKAKELLTLYYDKFNTINDAFEELNAFLLNAYAALAAEWNNPLAPSSSSTTTTTTIQKKYAESSASMEEFSDAFEAKKTHDIDLVSAKRIAKVLRFVGFSTSVDAADKDLINMEHSCAGNTKCQNYWGDGVRPNMHVGFIIRRNPSENIDKSPFMIEAWSSADRHFPTKKELASLRLDNSTHEAGVFYYVGQVIYTPPPTQGNDAQFYWTEKRREVKLKSWALGRFDDKIDVERAFHDYRSLRGAIIVDVSIRYSNTWTHRAIMPGAPIYLQEDKKRVKSLITVAPITSTVTPQSGEISATVEEVPLKKADVGESMDVGHKFRSGASGTRRKHV
jgi:hypothetical protein